MKIEPFPLNHLLRNVVVLAVGLVVALIISPPLAFAQVDFITLYKFSGGGDGIWPFAGLIQGSDGAFYGTTAYGGNTALNSGWGYGTVFRLDPNTLSLMTLHTFSGGDGACPYGGLIQGSDGAFYGTTIAGPNFAYNRGYINGAVFRLDPNTLSLATLHTFSGSDGDTPIAGLIQGSDGAFYGTTIAGGSSNCGGTGCGTVFRLDSNIQSFTKLYTFNGDDGEAPYGVLVQGSDGAFYGTTTAGGSSGAGTVFRLDPTNLSFTVLHNFGDGDGAFPTGVLIRGSDGALYGTTPQGNISGYGTVFRLDPNTQNFSTLHNFIGYDGAIPKGLIQGSDGALYGIAGIGGSSFMGGSSGYGTVFRLDPNTQNFSTLHNFSGDDGADPIGLIQGSDGAFYGTTTAGGSSGYGTLFRISLLSAGQVGNLNIIPANYDFGSVNVGSSSTPQIFTISSTGSADLHISGMALSDTTNYSINVNGGSNPCGSTAPTISPNNSCTVTVTFTPLSTGRGFANLTINSDGRDTPSLSVTFTGNGTYEVPPLPLNQEWEVQYYDQSNNIGIYPTNVVVDSSGNIIVAGYGNERVGGEGYSYVVIIKYDTNGTQLWVKRYDTTYGDGTPTFLAVDKSDNIYLTAYSGRDGNSNSATLKYDSNGNQLWVATYDIVYLSSLVVDNSGNVYVTGTANTGTPNDESGFVTIKYDSIGNQLWVKKHYINDGNSPPVGIRVDNSGYVYVTGPGSRYESVGEGMMVYYTETVKYDSDGNQLWVVRYENGQFSTAIDVAIDTSGDVYVETDSSDTCVTIKYDTNGNQLWVAKYDDNTAYVRPSSLAIDNLGNIYVTGTSIDSENRFGFSTIKYDSDGNQLWVSRFDDITDSEVLGGPISIALDSSGHVYVTGGGFNYVSYHDEELTIKYDTNGNQLWVAKKDCVDYASFPFPLLAVDTSGNSYVSGCSCTALKYSPNNTPTGSNLSIPLYSGSITFSTVTLKGDTTAITNNTGPIPPTGFQLGEHPIYYEIASTAIFSGPVTVCFNYVDMGLSQFEENNLVLLHYKDETHTWNDITSSRDTLKNIVCGITDSFSIFVVALPIDTIAPTTTSSPAGGTYTYAQNVTLNCNDGSGSGCANTKYCFGSVCTPATLYSGAINISSSNALRFYSTDNAGNSETVKTELYTINIDTTPPVTTASPPGGTYTSDQSVTLTCNDNGGSGCKTTYYCLGSGCNPTTVYSSPINIPSSTTLRFYSIDNANNSESVKTETYTILPDVTCSFTAYGTHLSRGSNLQFLATAQNNTDQVQVFQFATFVTLPNLNRYPSSGWLVGPITVTLNPHESKSKQLTQFIPYNAPFGTYTYRGYVGTVSPPLLYNQCQFDFIVKP